MPLMILASSMPLMPGISMSSTIAATSCPSSSRSASSAPPARSESIAGSTEHGLERVEVARLVVDEQRMSMTASASPQRYNQTRSSDSSCSVFTGLAM